MKSVYEEKPWLKSYLSGVPYEVEIPSKSLGEVFDEATLKFRNKTAIVFYGKKIKFGELREQVDRLATALSHLGIKKGDVVGVLLLNSPAPIIVFYSLVKLGAIITSISPVYVSNEVKHQIEDSGAETIICQDILYETVEKTGIKFKNLILSNIGDYLPTIKKFMGRSIMKGAYQKMALPPTNLYQKKEFYQLQELIKEYPPDPPKVEINPKEDIVILPYTSGTTGHPKGVMLTHYNIIADDTVFFVFMSKILEEGKEVLAAYMPFYHAAGLFLGVIGSIIHGNKMIVISNPDLDVILGAIMKYGVTYILGPPSFYESLKEYKKTRRVNWKEIKIVMSGADALNDITAKDWHDATGVRIHEMYGMTETGAVTHGTPFSKPKFGSMGIPIPNTISAIVDPERNEFVSLGEIGELVVSGPQVTAKGYWNNPESTKECECMINGIRWWRTGDLAKMDEDGYFYIYDRKRDLIKYKGLRVFAREVEEVLKTHPAIKEVGVVGVQDIKVGEFIKAMVVLESDSRGKLSEADIIEYCKEKIAPYKIPKIVEFLGELPKTDVGKVSRKELREGKD